jgi:tetratricopeptide (TPR) repeat protein
MDEKAYVGSDRPKKWAIGRPVVAAVIAVLLITAILGGLYFWHKEPSASVKHLSQTAQEYMQQGDYQKAYDTLKQQENKTGNKAQQLAVYDGLAQAATAQGKITDALHYYDLKHQLDPSTVGQDAYIVGTLYERSNNKQKAIEQFNLALNFYKSQKESVSSQQNIAAVQGELTALEKQP